MSTQPHRTVFKSWLIARLTLIGYAVDERTPWGVIVKHLDEALPKAKAPAGRAHPQHP
jgi:hypothetical protein